MYITKIIKKPIKILSRIIFIKKAPNRGLVSTLIDLF